MKWIKRLFISSSLAGVLSQILVIAVFATVFSATITITNTSATNYTYLPLSLPVNNDNLATQGYISSAGTDVQLYRSSTLLKRMLVDDRTLFVLPTLSAYGTASVDCTTNNTVEDFDIISGYGGYVTVIDDIDLEWGNSGNITVSGYFNPTSTGDIYSKGTAVRCYGNGDGTLTLNAIATLHGAATPVIASENTTTGGSGTSHVVGLPSGIVSGNLLVVAIGTNSSTLNTPSGWTQLFKNASTGEFAVYYKVASGTEGTSVTITSPGACWFGSHSYRITGSSNEIVCGVTASGTSANPDPPNLTSGWGAVNTLWLSTAYDVPSTVTGGSAGYTNTIFTSGAGGPSMVIGYKAAASASENPGTCTLGAPQAWLANTIAISPADISSSVTSGVIPAGERIISSYLSGGNLGIQVDGGVPVTVAYAGSITNNANNWIFCNVNIFSYIDYVKEYVSGVQQLYFAPNTIIIGTTLPDREATGGVNNGTFTWGTNPASISVEIGRLTFSSTYTSGTSITSPDVVGVVGDGIGSIARPNSDLVMPGNEFYPSVNTIATLSNIPIVMIWWFISFVIAILTLGIVRKYSNSIFAGGLMAVIIMALFCVFGTSATDLNTGGCLEWWQPAVVLIAVITQMVTDRTYSM